MTDLRYWQAINLAIAAELDHDPSVIVIGEDVGTPGGAFGATRGLRDRFGGERVRDTPISELAITGVGVGAALSGLRPVIEIMFNDFLPLALDQLVNQAAKLSFMTAGRASVPLTVRAVVGSGRQTGPQHGQSLEAMLAHVPGLKVVMPGTPEDACGLLRSAIRDDNPVVVLESLRLWSERGPVSGDPVPIGQADVAMEGCDVTLVCNGGCRPRCIEAAAIASKAGVSVEVIDLRSIQPLDLETLRTSLSKTGHLVVSHDAVTFLGVGAEVAAWAAEEAFDLLRGPVRRVASPLSPVPFAPHLEADYFPTAERIAAACVAVNG